jgi:cell division protein FtsW
MRSRNHVDYVILISFIVLLIFGFVMLASASSDIGKSRFNDTYYYLKHQLLYGLTLGLGGFVAGLLIPYRKYKKIAPLFLVLGIGLLILVFTPLGSSIGGVRRWLDLGPLTLQPAEIIKLFFVVYLAAWLSNARDDSRRKNFAEGFIPFIAICGLIGLLLLLEHSTSSVIIILGTAFTVYFAGGAKGKYILATILAAVLVISLFVFTTPYQRSRIQTYLNPSADSSGSGYQINQSLFTIGSGGITGVGYGNSASKKYLPERIGDSIFAIIAEEFGFVGSVATIGLFFVLVGRGLMLARRITNPMGRLLLVGFSTTIGIQAFVHIGATSRLIPLTGVPLPFVSYGGTALAVFMTMIGIMLNVSKDA